MPVRKAVKIKKDEVMETPKPMAAISNKPKLIIFAVLAVAILALLVWKFRTLFVVAMVNNKPITRYEFENLLMSRYGKQTLDELINERLVREKAEKDHVIVANSEVDAKIADLTKMLAGQTTLEAALAQQGMTMDEFRNQIYLQTLVEKIAAPQVSVTDKEIQDYITQNKTTLTATDEAGMIKEAGDTLRRQKTSQIFNTIFTDLKSQAKILKFL